MTRIYTVTRVYSRQDSFDWTPERVAELRQFWAGGMSSSEIGTRFGITKNAVIGKVQRLGISERNKTPKHAKVQAGKRQGKANAARKTKPPQAAKPKSPNPNNGVFPRSQETKPEAERRPRPLPVNIPPAPEPELVSVLGLTSDICHWPIDKGDDDEWRYCGAPCDPRSRALGKSYCTHHHARMVDDASRQRFLSRGR